MMKIRKHAATIILVLLTAGCVAPPIPVKAYDGPQRPLYELASVAAGPIGGTEIFKADNTQTLLMTPGGDSPRYSIGIHLLPGRHVLTFIHYHNLGRQGSVLYFEPSDHDVMAEVEVQVAAIHSYIPRAEVSDTGVRFYLEDKGENYPQRCLISIIRDTLPSGC